MLFYSVGFVMNFLQSLKSVRRYLPIVLIAILQLGHTALASEKARFSVSLENAEHAPDGIIRQTTATATRLADAATGLIRPGAAMEPFVWRTMFAVEEGSDQSLSAPAPILTHRGQLRSGALDGAEVEILRVLDGRLRTVRRDRIAEGGFQANHWRNVLGGKRAIDPNAREFILEVPKSWRPGASIYVGLRAVNAAGRVSQLATVGPLVAPERDAPRLEAETQPIVSVRKLHWYAPKETRLLSAPAGLEARLENGLIHLKWDDPNLFGRMGLAGYQPMLSDAPPEEVLGAHLQLEEIGPEILAGDLAILRMESAALNRNAWLADPVWNAASANPFRGSFQERLFEYPVGSWSFEPHSPQTQVADAGTSFLRVRFYRDRPLELTSYSIGPRNQAYYTSLEPGTEYIASVWLRGELNNGTVSFEMPKRIAARDVVSGEPVISPPLPVTPDWTYHEIRFTPNNTELDRPTRFGLRAEGSGQLDIDNLYVRRADRPAGGASSQDLERLTQSAISGLRLHYHSKTGTKTYSLEQLLSVPAGLQTSKQLGLAPTLDFLAELNINPWLQIEPHFSEEEWLGLVEYLAAPWEAGIDSVTSKPWAALRVRQGRQAPWTEAFDEVTLELGNEMWNRLFHPWTAPVLKDQATGEEVSSGSVAGLMMAYAVESMKKSPHWPRLEPKLRTVIGGWAIKPAFGIDAITAAHAAGQPIDRVGIAAYIGGWDEGEGAVKPTPFGLFTVLSNAEQVGRSRAVVHRERLGTLAEQGIPVPEMITYEGGPGYALNGLNRRRVTEEEERLQELTMKSHAAGTAMIDGLLARAIEGTVEQNVFRYQAGAYWSNFAVVQLGGHTYPAWDWMGIFNRELRGQMLHVETSLTPRGDLVPQGNRKAVKNAPLSAVYALRNGDRLSVVVVSRWVPGLDDPVLSDTLEAEIALPILEARSLSEWGLTGDFSTNDVESDLVRPIRTIMAVPSDLSRFVVSIPAGQAKAYVFDGVTWAH